MTTKQLKLRRLGEVLAAGVILGLACYPRSCFFQELGGRDPGFYFWAPPFLSAQRGGNREHSGGY